MIVTMVDHKGYINWSSKIGVYSVDRSIILAEQNFGRCRIYGMHVDYR